VKADNIPLDADPHVEIANFSPIRLETDVCEFVAFPLHLQPLGGLFHG
jgi:hypothetical protein